MVSKDEQFHVVMCSEEDADYWFLKGLSSKANWTLPGRLIIGFDLMMFAKGYDLQ
jgi:hypothetical protein